MLLAQLRTWRPWVVRDIWFRGDGGKGGQEYKKRNDGTVLGCRRRKAVQTVCRLHEAVTEGLRHYLFQAQASPTHAEAPSTEQDHSYGTRVLWEWLTAISKLRFHID